MEPNREQRLAIEHAQGPLLVTAGPGTGKTYVIERKVLHLVREHGVAPDQVLCLTFTEKAATELQDRITEALARDKVAGEVQASTFHGFCQGLLHEFAGRAGLPPHPQLLNGAPLEYLLLGQIERFDIEHFPMTDGGIAFVGEVLWLRQRCLQERISPSEAVATARARYEKTHDPDEQEVWGETLDLALGLKVVDRILDEAGALTYGDLIDKALTLVEEDPLVRSTLTGRFQHLLVDEFQDNNFAQAQLVHGLAEAGLDVTVVGDEDQSIYKFRGAYEATLKGFLETFQAEGGREDLVQNYRCTGPVLAAAERLIRQAEGRLEKPPLVPAREDLPEEPAPVTVLEAEWPEDEARAIAAEIERLHHEEGVAFGDVAILYRGANIPTVKVLDQALDELGIPVQLSTTGDLLERPEVKDLVSWLLVLRSPSEPGPALHRVLVSPEVGLPLTDEPQVTQAVKYAKTPGLRALDNAEVRDELSYTGRKAIDWLRTTAAHLIERRRSARPAAYVGEVLRTTGLLARHTGEQTGSPQTRGLGAARSLVRLIQVAREWERTHPLSTADEFVEYLSFLIKRGSDVDEALELDEDDDAVRVMTIHKAKGKEFAAVFVPGMNKGQVPPRSKPPRRAEHLVQAHRGEPPPERLDLDEERRLLFVAMTRAQDHLYLTRHHRTTATSRGVKKPSPFLLELGLPEDLGELDEVDLPPFLTYRRVDIAGEQEDQRPLDLDERLWRINRVGAQARALAATPADELDEATITEGTRRVVEQALQALSQSRPEADVEAVGKALAPVLGELDPRAPTRTELARETAGQVLDGMSFSPTAFRSYDTCPKRFYYRYVLGVPQPPQRQLEKGAMTHRILERFHREAGPEGTREELDALLDDEFDRRVTADHAKEAKDVRAEVEGYLDAFWKDRDRLPGTPERIEHKVNVSLEGFDLVAKLDRVDRLPGGGTELIDYKTGRAESVNTYVNKDLQIPLYVHAWTEATGERPRYATIWSLKDAKVVRIDVDEHLPEDVLGTRLEEAREIRAAIGEGAFEADPGWHCKWCPFSFICEDAQFT